MSTATEDYLAACAYFETAWEEVGKLPACPPWCDGCADFEIHSTRHHSTDLGEGDKVAEVPGEEPSLVIFRLEAREDLDERGLFMRARTRLVAENAKTGLGCFDSPQHARDYAAALCRAADRWEEINPS